MFCPPDVNTGFIKIIGPIQQQDLNNIKVKNFPLSIAFKPRTTIPSILGNKIEESTENTCTYLAQTFVLVDVQICNVVSSGYSLPGKTTQPKASLVLSFSTKPNTTNSPLSGILLCVPIYDTGTPSHNSYLDRIIDPDKDVNTNNKPTVPNLESIFYESKGDTTQTSFAYTTCFETININNNLVSSKSLYVVVFPNGITLTSAMYQDLRLKFNLTDSYPLYSVPAAITGGDLTLKSYRFDDKGNKIPTEISKDRNIYSTSISSCDDNFKHRFEYFTLPPRVPSNKWNSEQCPYYNTAQYKCVPFNKSKDLSGSIVIPGSKTLETIIKERDEAKNNATAKDSSSQSLTTEQIEGIIAGVAGVAIVAILFLKVGDWISKEA